jgi:hypothetical protein
VGEEIRNPDDEAIGTSSPRAATRAGLSSLEEIRLCDCEHAEVLLGLPKLRQVRVLGASATVEPSHVLAALEAKGVVIERL